MGGNKKGIDSITKLGKLMQSFWPSIDGCIEIYSIWVCNAGFDGRDSIFSMHHIIKWVISCIQLPSARFKLVDKKNANFSLSFSWRPDLELLGMDDWVSFVKVWKKLFYNWLNLFNS